MINNIAVQYPLTRCLKRLNIATASEGTERTRGEIRFPSILASLQDKLTIFTTIPKMLGFGGWLRHWTPRLMVRQDSNSLKLTLFQGAAYH